MSGSIYLVIWLHNLLLCDIFCLSVISSVSEKNTVLCPVVSGYLVILCPVVSGYLVIQYLVTQLITM